jgi:hypothetical protein
MATELPLLHREGANSSRDETLERSPSPQTRVQATHKFSRRRIFQYTWLWELISACFSTCCFVAICGVLIAYSGKPRSEWSFRLSLNAIVSILATGCRSSLALAMSEAISQRKWIWVNSSKSRSLLSMQSFDSASRGPLGSLVILMDKSGRSIVSLGAGVTILLLAFDPFMQQILSYPARLVVLPDASAVAWQSRAGPVYFSREASARSAIYKAMWASDLQSPPVCPSNHCEWNEFPSIEYYSHCEDVTSSLRLYCEERLDGRINTITCNATLPTGNSTVFTTYDAPSVDMKHRTIDVPETVIWEAFSL